MKTLYEIVREMEDNDKSGEIKLSQYVQYCMRETLDTIDAYLSSKHITGDTDSKGRDKPFFNICVAIVNIWYRATDIDRKNIKIKAVKQGDYIKSFLLTILLNNWMRKSLFGKFLNEWGRTLAKYGSAIIKIVEKEGELISEVMSWNRMIVDPVDFHNNIVIEKLWLTPAQLRRRKHYDQKIVKKLIENFTDKTNNNSDEDNGNYILLYEVHGEMPVSYLTDNCKDEETYTQQMHIISYIESDGSGDFDEYTLFSGREKKSPYKLTHLIEEDGRTLSIGGVETAFQPQWMVNHSQKLIKDQLDLASKLIFQTSDNSFAGKNALSAIETGDILIHNINEPLTGLNNNAHDVSALQSFGQEWMMLSKDQSSTPDAIRGNTMPSGTAYRQVAILNQESNNLFELMTENKGLYLEEIIREFVIPFLKKQMDTTEEITDILEDWQITQLDKIYIPNEAIRRVNDKIKMDVLDKSLEDLREGKLFTSEQQDQEISGYEQAITKELQGYGNQRFIRPGDINTTTWKEVMKDLKDDVVVEITGEQTDKQAALTTLSNVFQTIAGMGGQPMSDEMKLLFNKILETAGTVSPIELATNNNQAQPVQPAPVQIPVPAQQAAQ